MRKFQSEHAEVIRVAILQEIARNGKSRYDHRLHRRLLLAGGQSRAEVADLFSEDRATVQRWVRRLERGRLDAPREGGRSRRPRALDGAQWQELKGELRNSPREFDLAAAPWDGTTLSKSLHPRHRVDPRGNVSVGVCSDRCVLGRASLNPQVARWDRLKIAVMRKPLAPGSTKGG